jgi:NAD(P)-dependent dehydrogenase (short-subunit alcohol dehydrogenase family)
MSKVWLVTGSASGLGRNIEEAVLESGDRLVATARDTKRLDDLVKNTATAFARFLEAASRRQRPEGRVALSVAH